MADYDEKLLSHCFWTAHSDVLLFITLSISTSYHFCQEQLVLKKSAFSDSGGVLVLLKFQVNSQNLEFTRNRI